MHPYTVYGIETKKFFQKERHLSMIACTLIPFTVLKRRSQSGPKGSEVYGLHAPLYRLRY